MARIWEEEDCILADNNTFIRWWYGLQWRQQTKPHNVSFGNVQLQSARSAPVGIYPFGENLY